MHENIDKRIEKLENSIDRIVSQFATIAADFKFMREKISNYLDTHDKVLLLEERIKVANNRIKKLETTNTEIQKDVNTIKVKYASIAAIVSIVISFVSTLIVNAIK